MSRPTTPQSSEPDLPCRHSTTRRQAIILAPTHRCASIALFFYTARRSPRISCMQARCTVLGDPTPDALTTILMVNFKSTVAVGVAAAPAPR
jgi:hypothetical protein